jgi:hypothetical protein
VGDDSQIVFRQNRLGEDGQLSGSWAQIWLRHGACSILSSEPVSMPHNQFPPPQQCHEWSAVDPDGRPLEFVQQFEELCSLWVSLCDRHRQLICGRSRTGHAMRTTQDLVPEGFLNHCVCLRSTFPKTGKKFEAHSLFLSLIHR